MQPQEYEIMFRVEDSHFWYRALRGLLGDFLARHGGREEKPRLLDIGCGTGATLYHLRDAVSGTGIDLAPEAMIWSARRMLPRLARATALQLPFPDGAFDAALMMDVLYHRAVPDRPAALREARRILRPGGVIFLNVPACAWLYSAHDAAVHTGHRFTRRELLALLRESGFEPLECSCWNTLLFPVIAPLRLLRKRQPARGSDLEEETAPAVTAALNAVFALERRLIRFSSLPFGVSIFAAARKPGP
jgi:SAM-dependent methyltransferase